MKSLVSPLVRENFRVSSTALKTNRLRSVLTILIIAIGIMALVGILTAIDALKSALTDSFNSMGANSITIQSSYSESESGESKLRTRNTYLLTYPQVRDFAQNYTIPSKVAISMNAKMMASVKFGSEKSSPEMSILGVTEDYLEANALQLLEGRNFSEFEEKSSAFVAIVGVDVASLVKGKSAIDEVVNVDGVRMRVIGILKSSGAKMGGGNNKQILIPLNTARSLYGSDESNYSIKIIPDKGVNLDEAFGEANILFRNLRRLAPVDASDFEIERSDAILEQAMDVMGYVTVAAFIIGLITLLGASIGLTNIMLVSVNERTREIGTRKAIGAKASTIKQQFLFEAITIGELGGILGIILGVLAGNLTAYALNAPFVMPWIWIIVGVLVCLVVSVVSGYMPAMRAAALDPIEALRSE